MYYVEELKIEGRVYAGWTSHSAASSIYSQDDGWPSTESTPQISRQNSTATTLSKTSTSSKASTLYNPENIKSLGYTPFEYWKGPPPVPYPSKARVTKRPSDPVPPRVKATAPTPSPLARRLTPPPLAQHPALRDDDKNNPFSDIHALVEFRPVPDVRLRDIKLSLDPSPSLPPLPPLPQPPRSPRVKDRYAPREAERARRRALRRAQRARERALEDFAREWPGWIPDENALLAYARDSRDGGSAAATTASGGSTRSSSRQQGGAGGRAWPGDEKRRHSVSAASIVFPPRAREKWTDPRTWRRRVWGAVALVVVVLVIVAIILGQLASKDNMLSMPSPTAAAGGGNSNNGSNNNNNNNNNGVQRRLLAAAIHRVAEAHGAEDAVVPAGSLTSASSASSSLAPPLSRMAARRFHGRAWAV